MHGGGEDSLPDSCAYSQQPPSNSPYPTVLEVRAHTDSRGRARRGNRRGVGRGVEVPGHEDANVIVHVVWKWKVYEHVI